MRKGKFSNDLKDKERRHGVTEQGLKGQKKLNLRLIERNTTSHKIVRNARTERYSPGKGGKQF